MRILTFYSPVTNSVYCSIEPLQSCDYTIEPRPDDQEFEYKFNPETGKWEVEYEVGDENTDITISEAEALYEEAQNGSATAAILLKLSGL